MTYPTEFQDQNKTIGSSAILHPIYYFQVNLDLNESEVFGPVTNQSTVRILHPDQHQTSPDLGRTQRVVRKLQNLSWFATMSAAGNLEVRDDGTLIAYGQNGTYLKNNFTSGSAPLLTVLNAAPFTSTTVATVERIGAWANGSASVQLNNKFAF
jgi:hypothetical protein